MKLSIVYSITSQCPFSCEFCVMSAGPTPDVNELSFQDKSRVVERIIDLSQVQDVKCDISGGELLSDIRHIDLIEKLSSALGKENIDISISGAYLTPTIAARLVSIVNTIEITLDCLPWEEYRMREKRYHEIAHDAALLLKDEGGTVGIQTVLTSDNCDVTHMTNLYNWMCANRIDYWSILKFFSVGRGMKHRDISITEQQWERYREGVEDLYSSSEHMFKTDVDYHYLLSGHKKTTDICRCVKQSIGILHTGIVTSCFWGLDENRVPLDSKFILGNVPNESLTAILNNDKAKYWTGMDHSCLLLAQGL